MAPLNRMINLSNKSAIPVKINQSIEITGWFARNNCKLTLLNSIEVPKDSL